MTVRSIPCYLLCVIVFLPHALWANLDSDHDDSGTRSENADLIRLSDLGPGARTKALFVERLGKRFKIADLLAGAERYATEEKCPAAIDLLKSGLEPLNADTFGLSNPKFFFQQLDATRECHSGDPAVMLVAFAGGEEEKKQSTLNETAAKAEAIRRTLLARQDFGTAGALTFGHGKFQTTDADSRARQGQYFRDGVFIKGTEVRDYFDKKYNFQNGQNPRTINGSGKLRNMGKNVGLIPVVGEFSDPVFETTAFLMEKAEEIDVRIRYSDATGESVSGVRDFYHELGSEEAFQQMVRAAHIDPDGYGYVVNRLMEGYTGKGKKFTEMTLEEVRNLGPEAAAYIDSLKNQQGVEQLEHKTEDHEQRLKKLEDEKKRYVAEVDRLLALRDQLKGTNGKLDPKKVDKLRQELYQKAEDIHRLIAELEKEKQSKDSSHEDIRDLEEKIDKAVEHIGFWGNFASDAVGLLDPELGRALGLTTRFVTSFLGSAKYTVAALGGPAGWAAAAAFAVVDLFKSIFGGESTDQKILKEVRLLRKELRAYHEEMANRLEFMDRKFTALLIATNQNLNQRFDQLENQLARQHLQQTQQASRIERKVSALRNALEVVRENQLAVNEGKFLNDMEEHITNITPGVRPNGEEIPKKVDKRILKAAFNALNTCATGSFAQVTGNNNVVLSGSSNQTIRTLSPKNIDEALFYLARNKTQSVQSRIGFDKDLFSILNHPVEAAEFDVPNIKLFLLCANEFMTAARRPEYQEGLNEYDPGGDLTLNLYKKLTRVHQMLTAIQKNRKIAVAASTLYREALDPAPLRYVPPELPKDPKERWLAQIDRRENEALDWVESTFGEASHEPATTPPRSLRGVAQATVAGDPLTKMHIDIYDGALDLTPEYSHRPDLIPSGSSGPAFKSCDSSKLKFLPLTGEMKNAILHSLPQVFQKADGIQKALAAEGTPSHSKKLELCYEVAWQPLTKKETWDDTPDHMREGGFVYDDEPSVRYVAMKGGPSKGYWRDELGRGVFSFYVTYGGKKILISSRTSKEILTKSRKFISHEDGQVEETIRRLLLDDFGKETLWKQLEWTARVAKALDWSKVKSEGEADLYKTLEDYWANHRQDIREFSLEKRPQQSHIFGGVLPNDVGGWFKEGAAGRDPVGIFPYLSADLRAEVRDELERGLLTGLPEEAVKEIEQQLDKEIEAGTLKQDQRNHELDERLSKRKTEVISLAVRKRFEQAVEKLFPDYRSRAIMMVEHVDGKNLADAMQFDHNVLRHQDDVTKNFGPIVEKHAQTLIPFLQEVTEDIAKDQIMSQLAVDRQLKEAFKTGKMQNEFDRLTGAKVLIGDTLGVNYDDIRGLAALYDTETFPTLLEMAPGVPFHHPTRPDLIDIMLKVHSGSLGRMWKYYDPQLIKELEAIQEPLGEILRQNHPQWWETVDPKKTVRRR